MLDNNAAYKYETPYKGPFVKTQCWRNGMVILQYYAIIIRHNICSINPYTYDTTVENINCQKLVIDYVVLLKYQLYTSVFIFNNDVILRNDVKG